MRRKDEDVFQDCEIFAHPAHNRGIGDFGDYPWRSFSRGAGAESQGTVRRREPLKKFVRSPRTKQLHMRQDQKFKIHFADFFATYPCSRACRASSSTRRRTRGWSLRTSGGRSSTSASPSGPSISTWTTGYSSKKNSLSAPRLFG